MDVPMHLAHQPIVFADDYEAIDGKYAGHTDAKFLTIGGASYDVNEISVKVCRYVKRWSRQSEELPLHRVVDLNTMMLKSILHSANIVSPETSLKIKEANSSRLSELVAYYRHNREDLLPKLRDLKVVLDFFMQQEPSL